MRKSKDAALKEANARVQELIDLVDAADGRTAKTEVEVKRLTEENHVLKASIKILMKDRDDLLNAIEDYDECESEARFKNLALEGARGRMYSLHTRINVRRDVPGGVNTNLCAPSEGVLMGRKQR